jgi:ribosome-associated protein
MSLMIVIAPTVKIPWSEITVAHARSGGPGGQNVNKVSSKVILRWKPAASAALPAEVKARLLAQCCRRLTRSGDLLIISQRSRDQGRNLEDCLEKLRHLVTAALTPAKVRRATRPSRAARQRRLDEKKRRATRKRQRQAPADQ